VQVLDGILDGDDVAGRILLAVANHGGQGGGLPRTGGAGHEDQSPLLHGQRLEHLGKAQLLELEDLVLHSPQHHRHGALLLVGVDPETAHALQGVDEVGLGMIALEPLPLTDRHDGEGQMLGHLGDQGLALDRIHVALDPQERDAVGLDVDVRGLLADRNRQDLIQQLAQVLDFHASSSGRFGGVLGWRPGAPRQAIHFARRVLAPCPFSLGDPPGHPAPAPCLAGGDGCCRGAGTAQRLRPAPRRRCRPGDPCRRSSARGR